MAVTFACDRCGAPLVAPTASALRKPADPIEVRPRTCVVPALLPSTSGQATELLVEFSMGLAQDLCPVCFVSALLALVMGPLRITIAEPALEALVQAVPAARAALGAIATVDAPAPVPASSGAA
jgi:hypothetical protein